MPKDCEGCKAYMQYIEDHGMEELNRQNAELRADLTAALAQLAEAEKKQCETREMLKVACQWLLSADAITTVALEKAFHDINAVVPCPHAKEAERLREAVEFVEEQLEDGPADDAATKWILKELRRRAGVRDEILDKSLSP